MSACSSVKAYQKNRINDSEMELSARKSQKFEQNFQLYREGGSGANGGKSGGRGKSRDRICGAARQPRRLIDALLLSARWCKQRRPVRSAPVLPGGYGRRRDSIHSPEVYNTVKGE